MKRVYQTKYSKEWGDCVQACVASLFNLTLAQIPVFKTPEVKNTIKPMIEWVTERGYSVVQVKDLHDATMNVMCLVAVPSKFNPGGWHCVIGRIDRNGKVRVLHDPNKKNKTKVGTKIKDWATLYFIFNGCRCTQR